MLQCYREGDIFLLFCTISCSAYIGYLWHYLHTLVIYYIHYSVCTAFCSFCDSQRFTAVMMAMLKFEVYTVQRSRQKTFTNWWKTQFLQRKLSRIVHWCCQRMPRPQILQRNISKIVTKPQNLLKVFSLESFPLHGMHFTLKQLADFWILL